MARHIYYLLLLLTSLPLVGMEKGTLQVFLAAPEYWTPDGKQCDLDDKGQPCPVGPRVHQLELKYITAFPKLKAYLEKNENTLKGFDPKMFNLLQNCLGLSYIHKMTAESSDDQKGIEKEIEDLYVKEYSAGKVIDALYISRLAGLSLIERLAIKAFEKKQNYRGRLIRLDEVYPSFESLDEIGPEDETVKVASFFSESTDSDESAEFESNGESDDESYSPSPFASIYAWIKGFITVKEKPVLDTTTKELVRYKASPFAQMKFKKQPDTWFQKIKSWVAFILWN